MEQPTQQPLPEIAETLGKMQALTRALIGEMSVLVPALVAKGYAPAMKTCIDASVLAAAGIEVTQGCKGGDCHDCGDCKEKVAPTVGQRTPINQAPIPPWNWREMDKYPITSANNQYLMWREVLAETLADLPVFDEQSGPLMTSIFVVRELGLSFYPDMVQKRYRPMLPPNSFETVLAMNGFALKPEFMHIAPNKPLSYCFETNSTYIYEENQWKFHSASWTAAEAYSRGVLEVMVVDHPDGVTTLLAEPTLVMRMPAGSTPPKLEITDNHVTGLYGGAAAAELQEPSPFAAPDLVEGYGKVMDQVAIGARAVLYTESAAELQDQAAAAAIAANAANEQLAKAEMPQRMMRYAEEIVDPPTETPAAPTEVGSNVESEIEVKRKRSIGVIRGLLSELLSPNVYINGRGVARPGVGGLKQYQESILSHPLQKTCGWPSGFYFSEDTKETQFHLVGKAGGNGVPVARFIIPNTYVPDGNVEVKIHFVGVSLDLVSLEELQQDELDFCFRLLSHEVLAFVHALAEEGGKAA